MVFLQFPICIHLFVISSILLLSSSYFNFFNNVKIFFHFFPSPQLASFHSFQTLFSLVFPHNFPSIFYLLMAIFLIFLLLSSNFGPFAVGFPIFSKSLIHFSILFIVTIFFFPFLQLSFHLFRLLKIRL